MAIATANRNTNRGNGVLNRTIDYFETDSATAANTDFALGFKPRYVKFVNLTDRITDEWWEGMAADNALHTVAAGTRTLATSGGITVASDGTVTIPAALMVASKEFVMISEG